MQRILAMVLLAAAVGAGGCGGDDAGTGRGLQTSSTAGDAPATETNTPTIQEPGAAEAARLVDKVRAALDAAGYNVEDEDVSGTATNSLRVGDTSVVFHRSTADATADYAGIKGAFKDNPGAHTPRCTTSRACDDQPRNYHEYHRGAALRFTVRGQVNAVDPAGDASRPRLRQPHERCSTSASPQPCAAFQYPSARSRRRRAASRTTCRPPNA